MGRLIQKFRLQKYSDTFGRGRTSLLEFLHCLKYLFNLCSLSSEDSEADHFPPFHAVSNKFLLRNPLLSRYADLRLVRSRISSVLTSPVVGVSWHCKNYCSMSSTWNENFISVAQFTCPHESYPRYNMKGNCTELEVALAYRTSYRALAGIALLGSRVRGIEKDEQENITRGDWEEDKRPYFLVPFTYASSLLSDREPGTG